jgi:hypothetical protein
VGDRIVVSPTSSARITEVSEGSVVVDDASGLEVGETSLVAMAETRVGWIAEDGGNPGAQHFWQDAQLSLGSASGVGSLAWGFSTDRHPDAVEHVQDIAVTASAAPAAIIKRIPRNARTGTRLFIDCEIRSALAAWSIDALAVRFVERDPRLRRGVPS